MAANATPLHEGGEGTLVFVIAPGAQIVVGVGLQAGVAICETGAGSRGQSGSRAGEQAGGVGNV